MAVGPRGRNDTWDRTSGVHRSVRISRVAVTRLACSVLDPSMTATARCSSEANPRNVRRAVVFAI